MAAARCPPTVDDIKRFEAAALAVLGEVDPATELPVEQRFMASVLGKSVKYSSALKMGFARSLALLGFLGTDTHISSAGTAADWAASIARRLLEKANADASGATWQSLSDYLPLLAEAAPETFLTAVDAGLSGVDPVLRNLFTDGKDQSTLFARAYHSGLLWALETLAWSRAYLGTVSDLLARLDAVDPGGSFSNRPLETLKKIYCSWNPQTSANLNDRLSAVDGLRKWHPAVGWQVLLSMIPKSR